MTNSQKAHRLFVPFIDPVDMVMCCSADATVDEITRATKQYQLRFPLEFGNASSLREHVGTVEYASQSARFGPYADNIIGMNWELKSQTVVRVGERVIKSTTGYDLLRFLLHSDGRYGRGVNYVLRLRPLGGESVQALLTGNPLAIESAREWLLKSPWIHWLDVVDITVSTQGLLALHVCADCAPGEGSLFRDFFQEISERSGADLSDHMPLSAILPALSLKTTVSGALGQARSIVERYGGQARVLCVNGVVLYFPPAGLHALPSSSITTLRRECTAVGGHITGPWSGLHSPTPAEAAWTQQLESIWNDL